VILNTPNPVLSFFLFFFSMEKVGFCFAFFNVFFSLLDLNIVVEYISFSFLLASQIHGSIDIVWGSGSLSLIQKDIFQFFLFDFEWKAVSMLLNLGVFVSYGDLGSLVFLCPSVYK